MKRRFGRWAALAAALVAAAALARPTPPPAVEFSMTQLSREGAGILSGRGPAGQTLALLDWGRKIADLPVDPHGAWVYVSVQKQTPGAHLYSLAGGEAAGELVVWLPKKPLVGFVESSEDAVLTAVQAAGEPTRLLQKPGAADTPMGGHGLGLATLDFAADGQMILTGMANMQAEVRVYLDNSLLCRPVADAAGQWQCRASRALARGKHMLRADQMITGGGVYSRVQQDFTRSLLPASAFGGRAVAVKPGRTVWQISRQLPGGGPADTLVFLADKGQVKDPAPVQPGQVTEKGR